MNYKHTISMLNSHNLNYIILLLCLVISYINSECITGTITNSTNNCFLNKTDANYCCALGNNNNGENYLCLDLSKSTYLGQTKGYYNGSEYYLDCGPEATQNLEISLDQYMCGPYIPSLATECWEYSNVDNSCCYFSSEGKVGCGWAGLKYTGNSSYFNGKTTLSCSGTFVNIRNINQWSIVLLTILIFQL